MGIELRLSTITACLALATTAWGLDFAPCTEAGHEAFDCATLTVPLDRDGTAPGSVDLSIEQPHGQDGGLPVLLALAGGPGQSATSFTAQFAREYAGVLDRYRLVVYDQRGTGRSSVLDCPPMRAHRTSETVAGCADSLGAAARFHTTADTVLDMDDVRAALGVERLAIVGVSYGTHVALEFARTFPDHVSALVLDSTVPARNIGALSEESFGAIARVLGEICRDGSCAAFTQDPVADTATLVQQRLGKPLAGYVIDANGAQQPAEITTAGMFALLLVGDLVPLLQARYPAAVASALQGFPLPLLRLKQLIGLGWLGVPDPPREFSVALQEATECADVALPWQEGDSPEGRLAAFEQSVRDLPADSLLPFDRTTVSGSAGASAACLAWPIAGLSRASSPNPLPDVPALILAGSRDVRTPLENADEVAALLPRAVRVVVPARGHAVLTTAECSRAALVAFLHDLPVGDPCADLSPRYRTERPIPRVLREAPKSSLLRGKRGRTLSVVIDTVNDAIHTAAAVYRGPGQPIAVGGLRAGRVTGVIDTHTLHLDLDHYTLVLDAVVTGTIDFDGNATTSRVHMHGRRGGKLVFHADGSITGRLAGRRVVVGVEREAGDGWLVRPRLGEPRPIP